MDKNNQLVSIIIPCFNRENCVPATIESCLSQTYPDIEIIIVDDGSADRTLDACRKYEVLDRRVKVFSLEHRGQCAARNAGLDKSCGEYIKFLDSDDLLPPYSIEYQVKTLDFFQAEMAVAGSLGFTDAELARAKKELPPLVSFSPEEGVAENIMDFIRRGKGSTGDIMFSRRLLKEVGGFEPGLEATEELNLWLRIATAFPDTHVVYNKTPKLLLKRIGHDSQASRPGNLKWVLLSLRKAAENYLKTASENTPLKNYIFDRLYITAIYSLREGLKDEAKEALCVWKKGNLKIPHVEPWYHDIFHRIFGFALAERILDNGRKAKKRIQCIPK